MLSFLIIYALFLFSIACFLRVRIQVCQRYNNAQLFDLLSQGARICRTFSTNTSLHLRCLTVGERDEVYYNFGVIYRGRAGKTQIFYSNCFSATDTHEKVNDILRSFLKFVEDHQTYA